MQVQSLGQEDALKEGMQPTPVFLPGESHGHGYSPQGHKELDTTEVAQHACMQRNKIPHAVEHLSTCAATTESAGHRESVHHNESSPIIHKNGTGHS